MIKKRVGIVALCVVVIVGAVAVFLKMPGKSAVECGNYSEQSLPMAKYYVKLYREALLSHGRLVYPE